VAEYKEIKHNIYEWIKLFTTFTTIPAKKTINEDNNTFVTIEFGQFIDDGIIKDDVIKKEDGTLKYNILNKYKQKVELEFYGDGADYEALKVHMSISISSSIPFLKDIAVFSDGITNTTMAVGNDFEERCLLSLFVYFSIDSVSNDIDPIESIEFNGNIKGIIYE
jgi:hypothetical protein